MTVPLFHFQEDSMPAHRFEGFEPLSSDHLDGVKYSVIDHRMTVRFKNGYQYEVSGVEPEAYQDFLNAPSHGTHWHANIKDNYHVERVR